MYLSNQSLPFQIIIFCVCLFCTGLSPAEENTSDPITLQLQAYRLPVVAEGAVTIQNDRYWLSLESTGNRQYQLSHYDFLALSQAPQRITLNLPKAYDTIRLHALSQNGEQFVLCATTSDAPSVQDCYLHAKQLYFLQQVSTLIQASFSPSGQYLALLTKQDTDGQVQVFSGGNAQKLTEPLSSGRQSAAVNVLAFAANERYLVAASRYAIKRWTIPEGRLVLSDHTGWQTGGDNVLMQADYDANTARLLLSIAYDSGTGISASECLVTDFEQHKVCTFSCQGKGLLRPLHDDILTGKDWLKPAGILNSHTGKVAELPNEVQTYLQQAWLRMASLQFSPDGQWLGHQVCDNPETLQDCAQWRLLNWQTGQRLDLQLPAENLTLQSLSFLPKAANDESALLAYYPVIKAFDLATRQSVILLPLEP